MMIEKSINSIRIFRHDACGGMGYLGTYLEQRNISYETIHIDLGEPIPPGTDDISGLIFLGSTHSVNAGYSWITDEIVLIRRAIQAGVPVMGICFGGQLVSGAGVSLSKHPVCRLDGIGVKLHRRRQR
jgi:GMP synthase-like glutamine amidotransferase